MLTVGWAPDSKSSIVATQASWENTSQNQLWWQQLSELANTTNQEMLTGKLIYNLYTHIWAFVPDR